MALCSGIKADGGRCKAQAIRGASYCVNHHPDYEEARRRRNSKGGKRGGRGRPQAELAAIKDDLREVVEAVREGSLERGTGAVIGGLYNTVLRALEVQRKWHEADELERRIERLEEAEQGDGSWAG
jgi:hypothetical protein